MNKTLIVLVLIIVIAVIGYAYTSQPKGASEETPSTASDTTSAGMRAEENAVVVNEQRPGTSVTGSLIYLAAPGFLIIHEDKDGSPGAILGASSVLTSGENTNVIVALSRASLDGETLHAMLHSDIDGNSAFDASIDTPVQSILGGPISGWFEISASASENQPVAI